MTDQELTERIRSRLAELRRSPITAAVNAGLERTYLLDLLKGRKKSIKRDNYPKIAAALDWNVVQLLNESPAPLPPGFAERAQLQIIPGADLVGERDLPIFAATAGGAGHMIVTTDVIERVRRPAMLEGVTGAYGILIAGESMVPAYRPGDMALVHPHLQPLVDETHVFYDHDPRTGETESMIKHLLSYTEDKWKLQQHNPEKKFTVDRVDWPITHRVVGKYNRR